MVLMIDPSAADGDYHQALRQYHDGDLEQAARSCQALLERRPAHTDGLHLMGLIAVGQRRFDAAARFVRRAVARDDKHPEYLNTLGVILECSGQYDEAAACLKTAIALRPQYTDAYNHLGLVFRKTGSLKAALTCFQKAISLDAGFWEAHYNAGIVLKQMGMLEQALASFQTTLRLCGDHAGASNNVGGIHLVEGAVERAIGCFNTAIRIQPEFAAARMNLAMALLLTGRMEDGWREYEWRLQLAGSQRAYPHRLSLPRWDGTRFDGKTLLVHDEQGFGDTIQFVRYLPMVKALGGSVVLETRSPLLALLKHVAGIDALAERSREGPSKTDADLYIPLLSLPLVFNTTMQTIPTGVPYITADPARVPFWRRRIGGSGMRVGLVWSGSPTHPRDGERSVPVHLFERVFALPHVSFFALQKTGSRPSDLAVLESAGVDNLDPDLNDFADTAAAIEQMDLVISVDTAVAHLAGAMGKKTWCLLPFSPDWRWGLEGRDTPWYPSMLLYRQAQAGNWQDVIEVIRQALDRERPAACVI